MSIHKTNITVSKTNIARVDIFLKKCYYDFNSRGIIRNAFWLI